MSICWDVRWMECIDACPGKWRLMHSPQTGHSQQLLWTRCTQLNCTLNTYHFHKNASTVQMLWHRINAHHIIWDALTLTESTQNCRQMHVCVCNKTGPVDSMMISMSTKPAHWAQYQQTVLSTVPTNSTLKHRHRLPRCNGCECTQKNSKQLDVACSHLEEFGPKCILNYCYVLM